MTYVVGDACIGCRWGDCAQACPQQALRCGPNSMAIDPRACANCGLCALVCPEGAIHAAHELPASMAHLVARNRELAAAWPLATGPAPMPDAGTWSGRASKERWLQR